jgi:UDP-glucose 4-epimerase
LPLSEDKKVFPTNHYSVSKLFYENAATAYHQNYPEMETIGFRFMSVYGPNEEAKGEYANLISQFIWDFSRGNPPIIYGDGTQTRDFTNVADIVQGITRAIESREILGSTVFNIGRGEGTSLNDMIKVIKKYLKTDLEPIYIPNPVKENYIRAQHADITKISRVLGFQPTITLDEGIRLQIENLRPGKIKNTSSDKIR